jgi:hypothetical protein
MENLEQDDQEQLFIPPLNFAMVAPGVYARPSPRFDQLFSKFIVFFHFHLLNTFYNLLIK